jgi:hypothetical protein
LDNDSWELEIRDHFAAVTICTSATQGGLASASMPSSIVCPARSVPDIVIEIRLNCHILGRSAPLLLHGRKTYAGPLGFVPGGRATWFADYLRICVALRQSESGFPAGKRRPLIACGYSVADLSAAFAE